VQVAAVAAPATFVPGPPVSATGCDPDAAYDPTQPCRPAPVAAPVVAEPLAPQPSVLTQALPPPTRGAAAPSGYLLASAPASAQRRPIQESMTQRASYSAPPMAPPPATQGNWGIQVGAFGTLSTAEAAAQSARAAAPDLLRMTKIELPATTPFGSQIAFRSRLTGLTQSAAADACGRLSMRGIACITVPPQRPSY
jgi:hypothetical protein